MNNMNELACANLMNELACANLEALKGKDRKSVV